VAYENYVIDDDINAQVMRLVRGIEVTEETLALDTIHEVCTEGPGHYLGHADTIARMNSEFQYPHTAHRGSRRDWEEAGALDMRERARINARSILQSAWPQTITPELDAQLRAEFNILLPRAVMAPSSA
jgi:trimethylamine--corrinoid protein Co-methyltransferase